MATANASAEQFMRDSLPYVDDLFVAAMRLTRHKEDAEDLVQEAYLKALKSYGQFRAGSNIRAWMHRILKNTWFTRFQRRKVEYRVLSAQKGAAMTTVDMDSVRRYACPETVLEYGGLSDQVVEALESVPEPFRTVVILVDLNGLSYKEAAEHLSVAQGTVMSRLHRGRRKLRELLQGSDLCTLMACA